MNVIATARKASPPLRVCHLITDLDTGGAERSLVNLVTRMGTDQFSSDVVSLIEPGPMALPLREAGISITSLGMRRGRPTLGSLWSLVRHLRATKPVILQTWLYHADLLGTAAAWFAPPQLLLWNVRCTDMTRAGTETPIRWLAHLLALLSGRPDAIIANSQSGQRDHAAMGYHPKRWFNIPNGVDLERFRPRQGEQAKLRMRLGLRPNAVTIGLVARYHPMKDVATFLRAVSVFGRTHAGAQFVLCGQGLTRDNEALVGMIDTQVDDRIFLLGHRSDVDLIYPALDMLSLCSTYGEGFPNVLCEAMACGVPCVATDVGDSAKIIGECGFIVPDRNPEALAQTWETLLDSGPERMGEMARSHIAAHYGLDQMCAQYQELYRSLAVSTRASVSQCK
jgi:glycosyltransferase involved in cell wall biosynthesis